MDTVINTAVGRVLKAVELQLKHQNRNESEVLKLPGVEDKE